MAAGRPIIDSLISIFRQPGARVRDRAMLREGAPDKQITAVRAAWRSIEWASLIWAVVIVAAVTAIGWPLHHKLGIANTNVLMIYLVAVLWVATRHSLAAAVLTSLLGVLAFDFTFVPPYYTFSV